MKANLALNLFADERNLCAMSPWVQSAACFSIGVFPFLCWSAVWQWYRLQSQTDWHVRIGVASRRHQLRTSRVISFHRLLKCERKLGSWIRLQLRNWVSPPLNKFSSSSLEWVIWSGYWCHRLETHRRGLWRPSLSPPSLCCCGVDCEREGKKCDASSAQCPQNSEQLRGSDPPPRGFRRTAYLCLSNWSCEDICTKATSYKYLSNPLTSCTWS